METKRKKYDLTFKLTVVKFAEQNSGEAAARHFSVDPKRVREWRKNKAELQRLSEEDDKRARLRGGGRKKASEELEVSVCEWIHSMRAKHLRVSRKMIRAKAKEVYATVSDGRDEESFTASAGWLDKFLRRNDFSVRRRTTVAQKDAKHFTEKLVNFVTYTTRIIKLFSFWTKTGNSCQLQKDNQGKSSERSLFVLVLMLQTLICISELN
uniref:HTH CENPB-type domain-containing protein n=1 Tax=Sinocyclocheilus grahami TaxID=75366 RepID=A0A672LAG7_SINGR